MPTHTTISVRIPTGTKLRVDELAKRSRRSSSFIYNILLEKHLDELEKAFEGENDYL